MGKRIPTKTHKGQPYTYQKGRETIPLLDRTWIELAPEQQHSVMHGDGCGHPSNRPKSEIEAATWIYSVRTDTGAIFGFDAGFTL